ncbi:MAG: 30S ribosomal protein S6 [candidate division Zixibacteria bacterium]|nr:30S ribosomal protein S6 [candidate division Zixibacteria bacterium]MDD5426640.1 30S ribosomal protein S6 [candidate division Zixibacteria bacterium]
MRIYETTFIVNPQSDDSTIEAKVRTISDLINNSGGKVIYENRIGTRRLAYPIKRLTQGYYTSLIFEAEPPVLPEIERTYKLDESYLRFLTIVYEGDINKLFEVQEEASHSEEPREKTSERSDHLRGRRQESRSAGAGKNDFNEVKEDRKEEPEDIDKPTGEVEVGDETPQKRGDAKITFTEDDEL